MSISKEILRRRSYGEQIFSRYLGKISAIVHSHKSYRLLSLEDTDAVTTRFGNFYSSNALMHFSNTPFVENGTTIKNCLSEFFGKNPVVLAMDDSQYCGAIELFEIQDVNFGFPFDIDNNAIINIYSPQTGKMATLDWYEESGQQMMDVFYYDASMFNLRIQALSKLKNSDIFTGTRVLNFFECNIRTFMHCVCAVANDIQFSLPYVLRIESSISDIESILNREQEFFNQYITMECGSYLEGCKEIHFVSVIPAIYGVVSYRGRVWIRDGQDIIPASSSQGEEIAKCKTRRLTESSLTI